MRAVGKGLLVAAALLVGGPARGDASPPFEYVRDVRTIEGVVGSALTRAGAEPVLFVFDTISFLPPPGSSEFTSEYRYREDLPRWIKAIGDRCGAAPESRAAFVAASTSTRPVRVGARDWETDLRRDLDAEWWNGPAKRAFPPAHERLPRLLAALPGTRRTLVLVAGAFPPENWIRQRPFRGGLSTESWASRLAEPGAYWDEEKVGSAVRDAGASLVVVAPEARFGDFLPRGDIPDAPWASRPVSESFPMNRLPDIDLPTTPGHGGEAGPGTLREVPAARRGGRFESRTPLWHPFHGQQKFFHADSPSAYGHWPYARAAAKAGGAYYLYPFPPTEWLDVCPRDAGLVDALAPELVPEEEFVRLRAGDEALAAMLEAQSLVFETTPWTDASRGWMQGGASSWCGFDAPGRAAARWRPREKPWDDFSGDARSVRSWKEQGKKLASVVGSYDRALEVLAAARSRLAEVKLAGASRRSQANLRLCRFWFEMSAFHLDALRLYLTELDRFMPPREDPGNVHITYVPAFRLSDCLDAYDGRTISPLEEQRYAALLGLVRRFEPRGAQDNILPIPRGDPDYRAKREVECALLRLDSRLLPRALRTIEAARDVMAHEGRSAWGWVTYYSEAYTFVWVPGRSPDGGSVRGGEGSDEPPPTPRTPSGGGGPSTPK